jgi:hypothetical protein
VCDPGPTDEARSPTPDGGASLPRRLLARVTRLEWVVAGVGALAVVALVVLEPAIVEAPFENERTLVFTFGGTALAAIALAVMLWYRVPSPARIVVLGVPFVAVTWWLISPFFIDEVADDEFATSIAAASSTSSPAPTASTPSAPAGAPTASSTPATTTATTSPGPVLLGAGMFEGLAGHEGTGHAGVFRRPDGSLVLRLENLDIQNGPDLHLYVVPGAMQTSLAAESIYLGALRGNVGNLTYELPGAGLAAGDWTVLVWCRAFEVEFVGATLGIA